MFIWFSQSCFVCLSWFHFICLAFRLFFSFKVSLVLIKSILCPVLSLLTSHYRAKIRCVVFRLFKRPHLCRSFWTAGYIAFSATSTCNIKSLHFTVTVLFAFCVSSFVAGNPQRSDNCNQINLSGSSSSLASETSSKNIGQRSYGIGGAYLQKKIQQITSRRAERSDYTGKSDSQDARVKTELTYNLRKRTSPLFGRFRERSFSRERPVFSGVTESECKHDRERSGKQTDADSNVLHSASSHGNHTSVFRMCPQWRHKRRNTIWCVVHFMLDLKMYLNCTRAFIFSHRTVAISGFFFQIRKDRHSIHL